MNKGLIAIIVCLLAVTTFQQSEFPQRTSPIRPPPPKQPAPSPPADSTVNISSGDGSKDVKISKINGPPQDLVRQRVKIPTDADKASVPNPPSDNQASPSTR